MTSSLWMADLAADAEPKGGSQEWAWPSSDASGAALALADRTDERHYTLV